MLIGLATLIILLMGSGNDTFLLNHEIKKNVNTYVTDKENKKEIDATIKLMEKHEKEFAKKKSKHYDKKATELNNNYNSTRDEFDTLYAHYSNDIKENQTYYWNGEAKIRTLITDSEWKSIIEKSTKKPEKEKDRKKLLKSISKLYEGIRKTCMKEIKDSIASKHALQLIAQQQTTIDSITNTYFDLNYHHLVSLQNRKATYDDYSKAMEKLDELRNNILTEYTDLRFDLVKTVTKEEWSKIAHELDKIFKESKDFMI